MTDERDLGLAVHALARNAEDFAANLRVFARIFGIPNDPSEDATTEESEEANGKKRKRPPKIVDPLAPERPQSAYNLFIKENYTTVKQNFSGDNRELLTELGHLWKNTSAEKKRRFEEMSTAEKERFAIEQREYEAFRAKNPFDPTTEGITLNSKKKQQRKTTGSSSTNPIDENEDLNKEISEKESGDNDSSTIHESSLSGTSSDTSDEDSDEIDSDEIDSDEAVFFKSETPSLFSKPALNSAPKTMPSSSSKTTPSSSSKTTPSPSSKTAPSPSTKTTPSSSSKTIFNSFTKTTPNPFTKAAAASKKMNNVGESKKTPSPHKLTQDNVNGTRDKKKKKRSVSQRKKPVTAGTR